MNRFLQYLVRPLIPRRARRYIKVKLGMSPRISPVAARVMEERLTYLFDLKFANIERAIADIARRDIPGSFLECGIALGGSAIVLASLMPRGREFHGFDVFGMIPPPSARDGEATWARYEQIKSGKSTGIGSDRYYGYIDNLYDRVVDNFRRFGLEVDNGRVSLHKGFFEDTLHPQGAVALAHIDCDWYDPVKLCLERIYERLSSGGYIVLDDYNDYSGCRKAVDEIVADKDDLAVIETAPNFVMRRRGGWETVEDPAICPERTSGRSRGTSGSDRNGGS